MAILTIIFTSVKPIDKPCQVMKSISGLYVIEEHKGKQYLLDTLRLKGDRDVRRTISLYLSCKDTSLLEHDLLAGSPKGSKDRDCRILSKLSLSA